MSPPPSRQASYDEYNTASRCFNDRYGLKHMADKLILCEMGQGDGDILGFFKTLSEGKSSILTVNVEVEWR